MSYCDFSRLVCPVCTFDIRIIPHGNERSWRECDGRPMPHRQFGRPPSPRCLAGAALKNLLGWAKLPTETECPCNEHAEEMDREGCGWCREHVGLIVGWLREEIDRRRASAQATWLIAAFAWLPVRIQCALLGLLVRLAIHNAEWAALWQVC
jgi:hypothetical protein